MRVLLVNPAAQLGGGERSLLDMLGAARDAVEFRLIATEDGPLVDQARGLGVETQVVRLPLALARFGDGSRGRAKLGRALMALLVLPAYLWKLRAAIVAARPDIVHSNGVKAHILTALSSPARTALIWHVRDYMSRRRLSSRLIRLLAGRVRLVLANSDSVADDLRALLGTRVTVRRLYNGIDTVHFSPQVASQTLPQMASPDAALRIGLIATYARWKGHELFLEAARRYLTAKPPPPRARFLIVGGPVYRTDDSQISRAELAQRVSALGLEEVVELVPFQQDAAPTFRALDIVVNASTQPEPFGRTIVEALACGKPAVAPRHGGAVEVLTGPLARLTFVAGDADDLARHLIELAEDADGRHALGRAGRAIVEARFSHTHLGRELLDVYRLARETR